MRCVALLWLVAVQAWAEAPSEDRQQELLNLLKHDCGSCHGLSFRGGLGPALRSENLAGKDKAGLVDTILNGRPGTAMPPWRDFISDTEAAWLVDYLRGNQHDESHPR